MPTLAPESLALLVCPECHGALRPSGESIECLACGRMYPVRDGIPVLVAGEAICSRGTPR